MLPVSLIKVAHSIFVGHIGPGKPTTLKGNFEFGSWSDLCLKERRWKDPREQAHIRGKKKTR
jgi:hypothetical protein